MRALIVVDAQNECSAEGLRPTPGHAEALAVIHRRVAEARAAGRPVAWVRHHNLPGEPPGFEAGTWGAELSPGLGADPARGEQEVNLVKSVSGAFAGTDLGAWLERAGVDDVLLVGFHTHLCVSTTAREATMRGLRVAVDPNATAALAASHPALGERGAEDVHRSALLHLSMMGVEMEG